MVCANIQRSLRTRTKHERQAAELRDCKEDANPTTEFGDLVPLLLHNLGSDERSAIELRYLQQKSIGDIAAFLAITPDAAKKRVSRGLTHLRELATRR
jgi:DNA-directed RNA polymerase specialized sigma24 family protein